MIEVLVPIAIILLLVARERAVRRRRVRHRRRAAGEHRAPGGAGQPAGPTRRCSILEDPKLQDRYIATTQIGISVASLGLGMYGEHWLAEHDRAVARAARDDGAGLPRTRVASVIAVAILTYLHIVLGEMVPKALALQRAADDGPVRVAGHPSARARLLPLVVALNAFGNGLLRLVGIKRQRGRARAVSHRRGAAVHRPGEPGGRPAARRVGPAPARPVRVRRPDRR